MRIADDPCDAGNLTDLFGRTLRVAAGDKDLARWIVAMDTPYGGASVMICRRRDSTGIQY
jgi:hypothetical protein